MSSVSRPGLVSLLLLFPLGLVLELELVLGQDCHLFRTGSHITNMLSLADGEISSADHFWTDLFNCFVNVVNLPEHWGVLRIGLFEMHQCCANRLVYYIKLPLDQFESIKSRLLSNCSCGTLISYVDQSAHCRCILKKPNASLQAVVHSECSAYWCRKFPCSKPARIRGQFGTRMWALAPLEKW